MKTGQGMRKARYSSRRRRVRSTLALVGFTLALGAPDTLLAAIAAGWQPSIGPTVARSASPQSVILAQAPGGSETEAENPYGVMGIIQDWLARANREYQGIIIKELSFPPSGEAPEDAIAKTRDSREAEAARKAAEARAAADRKAEADAAERKSKEAAQAEAARKAEETKQRAEDQKRAEQTRRLADEAKRKADEIAKAIAEAQPQPDPEREAAANAAANAQRAEQERREAERLAEESRRQRLAEVAREARRAEEERKAAEARRAEEQRRADIEPTGAATSSKRSVVITTEPISRPTPAAGIGGETIARTTSPDAADGSRDRTVRRIRFYREESVRTDALRPSPKRRWAARRGKSACRRAGRGIRPPARYTIKRGDSLWRISKRFYRKGNRWRRIYRANRRTIANPRLIYPCQRVFVPKWR